MKQEKINEMVENIEEPVEQPTEKPAPVFGLVSCKLLNVREAPNTESEILAVLHKDSEVMVDLEESTEEFYSVCTEAGIEGFCMRDFIEV